MMMIFDLINSLMSPRSKIIKKSVEDHKYEF